jgi:signal transduction histidine kinase
LRERLIFLFVCEIVGFGLCLIGTAALLERAVLFALLVVCLLGLKLLLGLLKISWMIRLALFLAAAGLTYFAFGFSPYAALVAVIAAYGTVLFRRIEKKDEINLKLLDENKTQRERLSRQKLGAQSAEQLARQSERGRIALRLHDKVGHGVSGSILLLEGAMLNLEKNPNLAKGAIATATENLRSTVDEIRGILREERTAKTDVGRAEIEERLAAFGADYPSVKTSFTAENAQGIAPDVWRCVSDNLTEAWTNLCKHSDASEFRVTVDCDQWLIKVTFADNGSVREYKKGTGLSGMEERTALFGGRCCFRVEHGFVITMVFSREGVI